MKIRTLAAVFLGLASTTTWGDEPSGARFAVQWAAKLRLQKVETIREQLRDKETGKGKSSPLTLKIRLRDLSVESGKLGRVGYEVTILPSSKGWREADEETKAYEATVNRLSKQKNVAITFRKITPLKKPTDYDLTKPIYEESSVSPSEVIIRAGEKEVSLQQYYEWQQKRTALKTEAGDLAKKLEGLNTALKSFSEKDPYLAEGKLQVTNLKKRDGEISTELKALEQSIGTIDPTGLPAEPAKSK